MNAAWHGLARWAKELVRFAITIAVIGLVLVTLAGLFSGFEVRSFVGAVELTLMVAVLNILLWPILIGLAQTVLHALTLVQFVLMLADKGKPNAEIARFGTLLGGWLAKAAVFQTAQSEVRPWPFER